jgi:hypothetical protein
MFPVCCVPGGRAEFERIFSETRRFPVCFRYVYDMFPVSFVPAGQRSSRVSFRKPVGFDSLARSQGLGLDWIRFG